ncbi:MAG TPA: cysteine peptidase family C39 domain-containing protein [Candidatus Dojkabacteria bacterium]|nr:cysteine peptidase family C39 domain-containing protein [Candidatus Dojkabacteria bacterium]
MEQEHNGRNPIRQENLAGCGLACVAFIVHKNYQVLVPLIKQEQIDLDYKGMFCRDIIKLLEQFGITAKLRYLRLQTDPLLSKEWVIAYVNRTAKYTAGHYLVRYQGKWMDSWINYPEIIKIRAGFRKKLPGKVNYVIDLVTKPIENIFPKV